MASGACPRCREAQGESASASMTFFPYTVRAGPATQRRAATSTNRRRLPPAPRSVTSRHSWISSGFRQRRDAGTGNARWLRGTCVKLYSVVFAKWQASHQATANGPTDAHRARQRREGKYSKEGREACRAKEHAETDVAGGAAAPQEKVRPQGEHMQACTAPSVGADGSGTWCRAAPAPWCVPAPSLLVPRVNIHIHNAPEPVSL